MPPAELRVVLLILGFLVTDSTLGDPCVTHTVLDQPWRNCSHTECTGGQWKGDGNLAVGWYRFDSSGGWKIPETVNHQYRCSRIYSGWLNGPHPNVGEGEVTRTVCFPWDGDICSGSRRIRVKNCSGYFVYRLVPTPWGNAVYCTDSQSDTTLEPQESTTGEPSPDLSSSPAWSSSSEADSQSDTAREPQGSVTGDPGSGLTTSPAGSVNSDEKTSTAEQPKGSATGGFLQNSSALMDSSGDEDGWIDVQVTASGDMSEEEVREATRNKLREMFGDPDPQIELVQCTSEPPEE